MFKKILVGTDGFGPASKAVARAAELAQNSDAELLVVYAQPPAEGGPTPLRDPDAGASIDRAQGILKDVERHYAGSVKLRTLFEQGDPAEVLLDVAEAENVDLIVLGNKGMSQRLPLGVVPNRVSHHAPCSVLLVRTSD